MDQGWEPYTTDMLSEGRVTIGTMFRIGDLLLCRITRQGFDFEGATYPNYIVDVDVLNPHPPGEEYRIGVRYPANEDRYLRYPAKEDFYRLILADPAFNHVYSNDDRYPNQLYTCILARTHYIEVKHNVSMWEMPGWDWRNLPSRPPPDPPAPLQARELLTPWEIVNIQITFDQAKLTYINLPCIDGEPVVSPVGSFIKDSLGDTGFVCSSAWMDDRRTTFFMGAFHNSVKDEYFPQQQGVLTRWCHAISMETLSAEAFRTLRDFYNEYSVMPVHPFVRKIAYTPWDNPDPRIVELPSHDFPSEELTEKDFAPLFAPPSEAHYSVLVAFGFAEALRLYRHLFTHQIVLDTLFIVNSYLLRTDIIMLRQLADLFTQQHLEGPVKRILIYMNTMSPSRVQDGGLPIDIAAQISNRNAEIQEQEPAYILKGGRRHPPRPRLRHTRGTRGKRRTCTQRRRQRRKSSRRTASSCAPTSLTSSTP